MKINGRLGLIKKITSQNTQQTQANSTPFTSNPFGISFKGKTHNGDLFVKSKADVLKQSIAQKGKMAASAVIGSLVEIKNTFKAKIQPVIDFAKQTKAQISKIADTVSNFKASDLKISNLIKDDPYPTLSKQAKKLVIKPVDELESMWLAKA
ncbi:MAG: hypothetical protein PHE78_05170 [Candidatus Gastranaerophilales bacterium]|nr:hypothetical protein [Candidatus Gastranaerophilales bacterium]